MAFWKKGKVFRKGGKFVRYIYKNGDRFERRLVAVSRVYRAGKFARKTFRQTRR